MLGSTWNCRIRTNPPTSAPIDGHGGAQILLWDLTHPTKGKVSNQDFFFRPHPAGEKTNVTIKIKSLAPGSYHVAVYQIGFGQNDPYSRYLEMGSPSDLSREAVADLQHLSDGKPTSESTTAVNDAGEFSTSLPLREDDVYFISLTRQ